MLFGYDKWVTTKTGTCLLGCYRSFALCIPMLLLLICGGSIGEAQQPATSGSQPSTNNEPPAADSVQPKNDRIFGVLPNYRTVENPDIRMAPLSAKEKFKLAVDDSFDPYAYVIGGLRGIWTDEGRSKILGRRKLGPLHQTLWDIIRRPDQ